MRRRLRLVCVLFAIASSMPAMATVINFDTFPGGATVPDVTPIGNQYASLGVIFSAVLGSDGTVLPGATNYSAGPPGPLYSGNFLGNASRGEPFVTSPTFALVPRYDILRISFASAASGVSLSLNNFSLVGTTTFNAYNPAGTLIETFTTNAGTGWATRSLTSGGIARLDLLNNIFNGSPTYFGIDQLTYTAAATPAVPEPASWALMIGGFGIAGGALRRRATRVAFAG